MKKDYKNLLIWKSDALEISSFNESTDYLVTQKELNYRLVVNQELQNLIILIDKPMFLEDLVDKYNKLYSLKNIDYDTVYSFFKLKLFRYGIVCTHGITPNIKDIESYLSLSFVLINKKRLQNIIKITKMFLSIRYFYYILFSNLAFVTFTVLLNYKSLVNSLEVEKGIQFSNWMIYIVIAGILIFFHEFGHAG